MSICDIWHVSFSVTDLQITTAFYRDVLEFSVLQQNRNEYEGLGEALFGKKWGINQSHADLLFVMMERCGLVVEFIQYLDPPVKPYHMDPSVAGSAHIAFRVADIESEKRRLEGLGVEFNSPINVSRVSGNKWCYFRDPDGICLELVQPPK
jgi:glyoxylase I family protein